MLMRSALVACAAAMIAAPASAEGAAPCVETSFRIYFAHGSAALDPTVMQMMDLAEHSVAGCSYAALRVSIDRSSPFASRRAAAIRAAADGRAWDAVRIEQSTSLRPASFGEGPEFAEVTMTPNALPPSAPERDTEAGV